MRRVASAHRHVIAVPYPVSTYFVEGQDGIVTIDASLTVPGAAEMAAKVAALGKPLRAVLLTHSHPDHYAGLDIVRGDNQVPIIAEAVKNLLPQVDAQRDATLKQMFGPLWPVYRNFRRLDCCSRLDQSGSRRGARD